MVDQSNKPQSTPETTSEQGTKFLDHIVSKYGPGEAASETQKTRFLLQVARIQEGRDTSDAPKKIGR